MDMTIQALLLFMKSLPNGCMFDVISFGDRYYHISPDRKGFKYNDSNLEVALAKINRFKAELGGTEIFKPL